jgi:O-antigen/teichoic acid export membrane protein
MAISEIPSPPSLSKVAVPEARSPVALNAFHLLLGQIASTALSIALSAALGRTLGPADFGVYFLVLSMSTFAYVVVDWGQSALLIREAARRPDVVGTLLGSSLAFRLAGAAAAVVVTAAAAWTIGYPPRIQWLAGLMVVCTLPLALSQPFGYLFRGRDRMDLDAMVTVVGKALTVAATLSLLLLGGRLGWVIVAQGFGGLGALALAILLGRRIGLQLARPERATLRMLGSEGSSLAVFMVAIAVQPYLDVVILSRLSPPTVVGWYGAARNIIGVLIAPATIVAAASFPQLSRAASSAPAFREVLRGALRPLLGLAGLGAVGCFLFADVAVSLVYSRGMFGPAADVLQLYAPALVIFYLDMTLATAATAAGKTRALAVAKLVSVVVSSGLAVLFIPICQARYGNGGLGVVAAFTASEVVMLVACIAVLPRGALARAELLDLARAFVAALGTWFLFHLLPPFTFWLGIPMCVLVFTTLALALGLVSWGELARLARRVKR